MYEVGTRTSSKDLGFGSEGNAAALYRGFGQYPNSSFLRPVSHCDPLALSLLECNAKGGGG